LVNELISQPIQRPKRAFSKPFNPIGAIIEYLHIVVAITLIGTLLTVPYVILKKKPKYGTEGLIYINPYMPKILYRVEDSSFIHSFEDWMRTQVKVITSYPILEWAIKNYESQGFKWVFPRESMISAANRLNGRIKVVQIRDTQLITISMEAARSEGLAEMINCVINGYINSIEANTHNQDSYKLDVLTRERQKVQEELDEGYRRLEEISRKYGTAITEEKNLYIYFESFADLKKIYNKLVAERIIAESRMNALNAKGDILKKMPFSGQVADRIDGGQGVSGLINQINGRILEINDLMVGLTVDNPRHILLKQRQQEMEGQVERLLEWTTKHQEKVVRDKLLEDNQLAVESARVDYQTAKDAEKLLLKELDRSQKEILEYNTAVLHAQTKRQENQRLMESLTRINERTDQIQMEFASPGRITVTTWAQKPEDPNVDPRGKMVPICFIASLLAGVGVVIGRDMIDSRIKRPIDMEKILGFPLTGFVLRTDEEKIPIGDLYSLHRRHPRSFMTQQLAEIVVKMDRERLEHGSKVFAFTGLGDGCGVTMLAMNILAMSTVPRNRRLFIDLNTRNPAGSLEPLKSIMKTASGDNLPQGFLDDAVEEFPFTFYPSAAEMHGGRAHSSEDLRTLLEELKNSFDMIVIDLPPILLSADTQAIAGIADVVILTALARHSLWGQLMRSMSMLDDCGVKVISVVLNRVGFVRGGYLRKNLQAYHILGREKKRRLFRRG
jgi:capsular polysaccharide biosynthesis protein